MSRSYPTRRPALRPHDDAQGDGPDLFRIGWVVGAILAAFTIIEYIIAVEIHDNFIALAAIAVVKVVLIVWYFMHVNRLWRKEAH
ncbi:MAG: cytochrome C oxidase subunit IV family protein [Tepidiformaceae bacterium]